MSADESDARTAAVSQDNIRALKGLKDRSNRNLTCNQQAILSLGEHDELVQH